MQSKDEGNGKTKVLNRSYIYAMYSVIMREISDGKHIKSMPFMIQTADLIYPLFNFNLFLQEGNACKSLEIVRLIIGISKPGNLFFVLKKARTSVVISAGLNYSSWHLPSFNTQNFTFTWKVFSNLMCQISRKAISNQPFVIGIKSIYFIFDNGILGQCLKGSDGDWVSVH